MRINLIVLVSGFCICVVGFQSVLGATWYIRPDGTGDVATIQAGINSATTGDTVLLASGTFAGTGNRFISVPNKALTIISESGAQNTIIDCQGLGRGFSLDSFVGPSTTISGITIENAWSTHGGAIDCNGASPRIQNNIIRNCWATMWGGAVFCADSYASIQNNLVIGCSAPIGGAFALVRCFTDMDVVYNTIIDNTATQTGGGIHCSEGSPNIANNTIVGNGAPLGGGIFFAGPGIPVVYCNIIASSIEGAGIHCHTGAWPWVGACDLFANFGGDAICGSDGGFNFSADPEFCGTTGVEYWLSTTSPCAPQNNPLHLLVGAWPAGCTLTGINDHASTKAAFRLLPSSPNPFTLGTRIAFVLDNDADVHLTIYDVAGRRVRALLNQTMNAGMHIEEWDGHDNRGSPVAGGIYLICLTANRVTLTGKIVRLR